MTVASHEIPTSSHCDILCTEDSLAIRIITWILNSPPARGTTVLGVGWMGEGRWEMGDFDSIEP